MQKFDYIYMIIDNVTIFNIQLPSALEGGKLNDHLNTFDENILIMVAGFSQVFLEHFLIVSKGQSQKELEVNLKKMDLISQMIGPTGNLNYLGKKQIEYILTKIGTLNYKDITEHEISVIADEQLEKEYGSQYNSNQALENHLASAAFYLISQGYSKKEIEEIFVKVRQDPSKLDAIFTLPQKEIYSVPSELQQNTFAESGSQPTHLELSQETQEAIDHHIDATQHEISGERAQKVDVIMQEILDHVKDNMPEQYERIFRQIHPDRLNRALKMLKQTKRKSKKQILILEWFFCSHLLSGIELKVEHWQVSSQATQGQHGVYTAGIDFSRYDPIVRDFSDSNLAKVINIARRMARSHRNDRIRRASLFYRLKTISFCLL
ncbi:MAG: hypothetical protein ACTSPS_18825 [Promethearchaeota archaeon]